MVIRNILFAFLFISCLSAQAQSYSGVYTLGGTSSNFSSFKELFDSLQFRGVSGNVTINVNQGTYSEQFHIDSLKGVGPNKRVTIQPNSLNTSPVTWTCPTTTSKRNLLTSYNKSINYLTIKGLVFKAGASNLTSLVSLRGDHITFINNTFYGKDSAKLGGHRIRLLELSGSKIRVDSNNFYNESKGLSIYGSTSKTDLDSIWVTGNRFVRIVGDVLYVESAGATTISGNQILATDAAWIGSFQSNNTFVGISLKNCIESDIIGNTVRMTNKTSKWDVRGIVVDGVTSNSNIRLVANNSIHIDGRSTTVGSHEGLVIGSCKNVDVVHNSIRIDASRYKTDLVYAVSNNKVNFYNNNLILTTTKGKCYSIHYNGNIQYNNVYAPNSSQRGVTHSSNLNLFPKFIVGNQLLLNGNINPLYGSGKSYAAVKYDIQGEKRSATKPTIGCDEVIRLANDAGISAIENDVICSGSGRLNVRLTNFGLDTLKTCTIYWKATDQLGNIITGTPFSFTGSILPAKDTSLQVGNFTPIFTRKYSLTAFTALPNGVSDSINFNDTVVSAKLPVSYQGTFTVGGLGADFESPKKALDSLKKYGMCDDVTLQIRPGNYNEQLKITGITGLGQVGKLTIRNDILYSTKPTIWFKSFNPDSNYVVLMDSVSKVRITGLNLKANDAGYSHVFEFRSDISDVEIDSCNMYGKSSLASVSPDNALVFQGDKSLSKFKNLKIKDCSLLGGAFGLYFRPKISSTDIDIQNNAIEDFTYTGLYFKKAAKIRIKENQIILNNRTLTSVGYGIFFDDGANTGVLDRNNIRLHTLSKIASLVGIQNLRSGVPNDSSRLTNCIIDLFCEGEYKYAVGVFTTSGTAKIVNNTIKIHCLNPKGNRHYGIQSYNDATAWNNIVFISPEGIGIKQDRQFAIGSYNNNNLYVPDGTPSNINLNNTHLFFDPQLDSISLVPLNTLLANVGKSYKYVSKDFSGKTRLSKPSLGAFEIKKLRKDAGIIEIQSDTTCASDLDIKVRVANFGLDTLTNVICKTEILNQSGSYTFKDTVAQLLPNSSKWITPGKVKNYSRRKFEVRSFIYMTGILDSNVTNDTAVVTKHGRLKGDYKVGGNNPDFKSISEVTKALKDNGICSDVTFWIRPGIYNEELYLGAISSNQASTKITFRVDTGFTSSEVLISSSKTPIWVQSNVNIDVLGISFYCHDPDQKSAVIYTNNSQIIFRGNKFSRNGKSSKYELVRAIVGGNSKVTFEKNILDCGGGSGLSIQTFHTTASAIISRNEIFNFVGSGIVGGHSTLITNNIISGNGKGINVSTSYFGQTTVSKNVIDILSTEKTTIIGTGIRAMGTVKIWGNLINFHSDVIQDKYEPIGFDLSLNALGSMIANNMLSFHSDSSINGIAIKYSGSNDTLVHNTIRGKVKYGIVSYSNTNLICRNNIIDSKTSGGYSVGIFSNGSFTVDHNLIYADTLYNGVTAGTGSLSFKPKFVSNYDAHIIDSRLVKKGIKTGSILSDIDGQVRHSSTPDIGADEFDSIKYDIAIYNLEKTNSCHGSNSLNCIVSNNGLDTINSFYISVNVKITSSVLASQNLTKIYYKKLNPGQSINLNINGFQFLPKKHYEINADISSLKKSVDGNQSNNSAKTVISSTFFAGPYSVGQSGYFKSINGAINQLSTYGICDNVFLNLIDSIYPESVTLEKIYNADDLNRVTIQTQPGLKKQAEIWTDSTTIIGIGGGYYTISDIKISSNSSKENTIYLKENTEAVTIMNNEIIGGNGNLYSSAIGAVIHFGFGMSMTRLKFLNNSISGGNYNIWSESTYDLDSLWIEGNSFSNGKSGSVFLNGKYPASYQSRANGPIYFNNNDFTNIKFRSWPRGIHIGEFTDVEITNNKGLNNVPAISINVSAIGLKFQNNMFGSTSIEAKYSAPFSNNILVGYNRIHGYGSGWDTTELYHNTFVMPNGPINSREALNLNGSTYIVENNIMYNGNASNYALSTYGGGIGRPTIFVRHRNNLYYGKLRIHFSSTLWANKNISGVPTWKQPFDGHITGGAGINKGLPISGLTKDIDGDARSLIKTDLGADEISSSIIDAQLVSLTLGKCEGSTNVFASVKNNSSEKLDSVMVVWYYSINNGNWIFGDSVQTFLNYPMSQKKEINLGLISTTFGNQYKLKGYALYPSNFNDSLASNDSLLTTNLQVKASPTVSLNLNKTSYCKNDTAFLLKGGTPTGQGGKYFGNGIKSGYLYPSLVKSSRDTIYYTYTDTFGCKATVYYPIQIDTFKAHFNLTSSLCEGAPLINLRTTTKGSGAFFINGKSDSLLKSDSLGIGKHFVHYIDSNLSGCADTAFQVVEIGKAPSISILFPTQICLYDTLDSKIFGNYVGALFVNRKYSNGYVPTQSKVDTLVFTVNSNLGCKGSDTGMIKVKNLPILSPPSLPNVCSNGSSINLKTASAIPTGGVWTYSGSGVSNGTFYPASAGAGLKSIKYGYVDSNQCKKDSSVTILVKQSPRISFSALGTKCIDDSTFTLSGGTPIGGTYTGKGVVSGSFSPLLHGVGSSSIWYRVTSTNGCIDSLSARVNIYGLPIVSYTGTKNYCENIDSTVLSGGFPIGGSFLGKNVFAGKFKPTIGSSSDTIIYNYIDINGCRNSDTIGLRIDTMPIVSFSITNSICNNSPPLLLSGGLPKGGIYKGSNVTGGIFSPNKTGWTSINYYFEDANGCKSESLDSIFVDTVPKVSLTTFPSFCEKQTPYTLVGGRPKGGVYTVNGDSITSFDPQKYGRGTYFVTYKFLDSKGCQDSTAKRVSIWPSPNSTWPGTKKGCQGSSPLNLQGGQPLGGYYFGNLVDSVQSTFNLSTANTGAHTVHYTNTNSWNCSDTAQSIITVYPIPMVNLGLDTSTCDTSLLLDASNTQFGSTKYLWSSGDTNAKYQATTSGLYWVQVTKGNLCSNMDSILIAIDSLPQVDLGNDTAYCLANNLGLDAGNYHYSRKWNTGDTTKKIQITKAGIYNVEVKSAEGCISFDTIVITATQCVGINELGDNFSVLVYPNPTPGQVTIQLKNYSDGEIKAEVLSSGGQLIKTKNWTEVNGINSELMLDLGDLSNGIYFIRLGSSKWNQVFRINLQR